MYELFSTGYNNYIIQHVSVFRTFSSLERSSLVELSRDKDESDIGLIGDNVPSVQISKDDIDATDGGFPCKDSEVQPTKDFPQMSITAVLQGFSIGASLLPSLKVEYKVRVILGSWFASLLFVDSS